MARREKSAHQCVLRDNERGFTTISKSQSAISADDVRSFARHTDKLINPSDYLCVYVCTRQETQLYRWEVEIGKLDSFSCESTNSKKTLANSHTHTTRELKLSY